MSFDENVKDYLDQQFANVVRTVEANNGFLGEHLSRSEQRIQLLQAEIAAKDRVIAELQDQIASLVVSKTQPSSFSFDSSPIAQREPSSSTPSFPNFGVKQPGFEFVPCQTAAKSTTSMFPRQPFSFGTSGVGSGAVLERPEDGAGKKEAMFSFGSGSGTKGNPFSFKSK